MNSLVGVPINCDDVQNMFGDVTLMGLVRYIRYNQFLIYQFLVDHQSNLKRMVLKLTLILDRASRHSKLTSNA